ncbi:PREDICTED: eye-specific diacylglycerol kinase isoform X2 [Nicrophorus vespilloides]|uniref:Diacylglycerol kinase n=1 Tax=Nicrophorus vespilloides TaxID=110193 RepID=A0ABM1N8Y0_NICVS|nr:PREDICTED: eye-specific diacylglycerol kinase isoform X2 [Nicrophorus vespilloides]
MRHPSTIPIPIHLAEFTNLRSYNEWAGFEADHRSTTDDEDKMNRLRTTFKRSRTPTGAEMKTQSSLEVPKQVRSASFDEIQLEAKRSQNSLQNSPDSSSGIGSLLRVPQVSQRSRSVDSGASTSEETSNFLEVPRRFQRRRSSGSKSPTCVHCLCVEEYSKRVQDEEPLSSQNTTSITDIHSDYSDDCDDDGDDDNDFEEDEEEAMLAVQVPECSITVTLSPTIPTPQSESSPPYPLSPKIECFPADDLPTTPTRRRSIHRQEAFFAEPGSTENVSEPSSDCNSEIAAASNAVSESPFDGRSDVSPSGDSANDSTMIIHVGMTNRNVYLEVPDVKRDRAASVDSCFSKVSQQKTEEVKHTGISLEVPAGPSVNLRSRSVDIVLPTDEQARYKALAMAVPPPTNNINIATPVASSIGRGPEGERVLRATPDWADTAISGDHLWVPTSVSGDFCYVGDADCTKHGPRLKCSACNVVVHHSCLGNLLDRLKFTCKPSFLDSSVRQYRERTTIQHHWVHRRSEKGKCRQCGKSFQSKLSFSNKEIVALCCSWCKVAYHNKESCFNVQRIEEDCKMGVHSTIIVPPVWILKLPKKGAFKSSLRKSPKKRSSSKKKPKEPKPKPKDPRSFIIKPVPLTGIRPVIVFINPKSGGNQGAKLLQKFQWLLNPRQVFDLTQGGPKMGLEMFKNVPNLRILACGGDGTVGWVLSVIDQIEISPVPAVGVLPLGTGNDLARALGWGGGYTDEPISKILTNLASSDTVQLDRWSLEVEKNPQSEGGKDDGKENLPLNVVNNYFSMGVDAHIALEFHEAREAHPERFNSRLRNKMFYGQMGGKDLLRRKWKGLAELVTLECDGKDLTPKLKELKVHAVVFLNIPSYGGGTHPWNRSMGSSDPTTDDGLIEVVGLTTYQLPLLQAGGHGTCITQCKTARIVTSKTIPMQVDGEACKLAPSIIKLSLLNKATMLAKRKGGKVMELPADQLSPVTLPILKISMSDYEMNHYDKDLLTQAAQNVGQLDINPASDLDQIRGEINKLLGESNRDWCFVDSCTAERFFRIDKAQENLHYVADISTEALYILECEIVVPQTPTDDDPATISTISSNNCIIPEMRVSDEGSLDSPSDQPPMSPKVAQSPEDVPTTTTTKELSNGDSKHPSSPQQGIKIRSVSERLFGLSQESYNTFSLNEKPSDLLLRAARLGDLQTIKELHTQGYSLLSKDGGGQTVLHIAARFDQRDIVKYLLGQAPSVLIDMKDSNLGQTALHKAATYKCRTVCCMLVAGGASLTILDSRGLTPRLLALQADDHELAAYLESQEHYQIVSADVGTTV